MCLKSTKPSSPLTSRYSAYEGECFRPVSYTHLDVYKRQVCGRTALRMERCIDYPKWLPVLPRGSWVSASATTGGPGNISSPFPLPRHPRSGKNTSFPQPHGQSFPEQAPTVPSRNWNGAFSRNGFQLPDMNTAMRPISKFISSRIRRMQSMRYGCP